MPKTYQEIQCYNDDHPRHFTYYLESEKELNHNEVIIVLTNRYLGVHGLELYHIDNIVDIRTITADEYETRCGLKPAPTEPNHLTLEVSFEIDGSVSIAELVHAVRNVLAHHRDNVGFEFEDKESFIEAITVTSKSA